MASKIKKGDQVVVIAGAQKGTVGTVATRPPRVQTRSSSKA